MSEYTAIRIPEVNEEESALLVAALTELGFDGFEEKDSELNAFIPTDRYNEKAVNKAITALRKSFTRSSIPDTNWNEIWESGFEPVLVEQYVSVRADFHKPAGDVLHEIVITPKMSFGTGHHATTYMMLRQMMEIDFTGKTVLDFGTGTGVLAILAEMRGAAKIIAIDHDEWSISNAIENIKRNDCTRIEVIKSDVVSLPFRFDVMLANINKNVILEHFPSIGGHLGPSADLLLSGFLTKDCDDIFRKSVGYLLHVTHTITRDGWVCLHLTR